MVDREISATLVYATPDSLFERSLVLPEGATVGDAIKVSGIAEACPEAMREPLAVGIFSRPARLETTLHDGDRVELYRPLQIDPKSARRRRAARKPDGSA